MRLDTFDYEGILINMAAMAAGSIASKSTSLNDRTMPRVAALYFRK